MRALGHAFNSIDKPTGRHSGSFANFPKSLISVKPFTAYEGCVRDYVQGCSSQASQHTMEEGGLLIPQVGKAETFRGYWLVQCHTARRQLSQDGVPGALTQTPG